jgi:hypothetical protein
MKDNIDLEEIWCDTNNLTGLDVSESPNLLELVCDLNSLTNLDISQNSSLERFSCTSNQLTSLNAKNGNNANFSYFVAYDNLSLECIQVDNETDANNGVAPYDIWEKDISATYSEDCEYFLGINDELLAEGLNMYPNPVTSSFVVETREPIENVQVYTVLGQKVKEVNSNFNSISTEILSKGVYIIKINSENGSTMRRLIKQ